MSKLPIKISKFINELKFENNIEKIKSGLDKLKRWDEGLVEIDEIFGFFPKSISGHNSTWDGYEMHCIIKDNFGELEFKAIKTENRNFSEGDLIIIKNNQIIKK